MHINQLWQYSAAGSADTALNVEIQEAMEVFENEANFTQVAILLQQFADVILALLSDNNEWVHEPKHTAQGMGSGHVRLLHNMADADCMPPSAATLFEQKVINVHVTFDLASYCHAFLGEVRSACKSRECMPSDSQSGGKTSMSSAIFLHGNGPWSSYAPVHGPVHSPQGTTSLKCKSLNQVESGHIKCYPKLAKLGI